MESAGPEVLTFCSCWIEEREILAGTTSGAVERMARLIHDPYVFPSFQRHKEVSKVFMRLLRDHMNKTADEQCPLSVLMASSVNLDLCCDLGWNPHRLRTIQLNVTMDPRLFHPIQDEHFRLLTAADVLSTVRGDRLMRKQRMASKPPSSKAVYVQFLPDAHLLH